MPCIADQCRQGRTACPEPGVCYPDLHRVTVAAEPCTEIGAEQNHATRTRKAINTERAVRVACLSVVGLLAIVGAVSLIARVVA